VNVIDRILKYVRKHFFLKLPKAGFFLDRHSFIHSKMTEMIMPQPEPSPVKKDVRRLKGRWSAKQTFAALKYPNYRLWFWGQMVSLFGTWMQMTAQGFLVFELTHSPAYLGYVGFSAGVPTWLLMLYGGVIADRMSRRTLLIITQTSMMVLAFILAALAFLHLVQPWHIIFLAFCLGVANAFDAPARQSFVLEMVEREDLTNAIALNSTMFNSATAVGPAVSGVTYALFGPAWCFTINGISFIAVIGALTLMKLKSQPSPVRRNSIGADLKEGIRYARSHPMIRTLIGLVGVTSLFGFSFTTLLPAWAVTIMGGNATTNGLLQSARGAGAFFSALFIASLGRFKFKGKLLTFGTFAFPALLLVFSFVRFLPLSLFMLVGVGAATILIMNLANALVQTLVSDSLRGRVMGIYALTFFGLMPIGALWIGSVAQHIGAPNAVIIASLISLVFASLVWTLVPKLRTLQ
jgi:MFS family permease